MLQRRAAGRIRRHRAGAGASGVYAMLAFGVAGRRREIAVRLALGASAEGIMALVLRSGLALALAGIAVGTVAALG